MDSLPTYSTDLVMSLDVMYPLSNPRGTDDLASIQRKAGQRDVVEHLLILLNRDKEDDLRNHIGGT